MSWLVRRLARLFRSRRSGQSRSASETRPEPERDAGSGADAVSGEQDQAELQELFSDGDAELEACLLALREARLTPRERPTLEAVVAARAQGSVPEQVLVAAADLFVQRGEPQRALGLLDGVSSSGGLLLAADIRAERGEVARALTLVERVLARDLDAPGARERHQRYQKRLPTAEKPVKIALDGPTLLRADLPRTNVAIVGEAGRGGAGSVYEAVDEALGRKVALKLYHRPTEDRDKLEREARLAVRFAGRGVVRVYEVDPAEGWIMMEWVAGGSLKRWLERADPVLLCPLARWFVPLVEAASEVHRSGLVHADLKPSNVLLRAPDEPVMSDFGIACALGQPALGGSFGYLSPERLLGEPLTPADDVFALGRILEDALDAAARGRQPGEPATEERARWHPIVRAALADRADRPADASELLQLVRHE